MLDEVCAYAAPGSWLGFDIVNDLTLTHPLTKAWIEMQAQAGAPWIGALDDPEAFLSERNWQACITQIGQPDAIYGGNTRPYRCEWQASRITGMSRPTKKINHTRRPPTLLSEILGHSGKSFSLDSIYLCVAFLPSRMDALLSVANRCYGIFQSSEIKVH